MAGLIVRARPRDIDLMFEAEALVAEADKALGRPSRLDEWGEEVAA